ncbi:MAG: hypothetical protein ABMA25_01230 [Ilumatobacteraceae bacterium]
MALSRPDARGTAVKHATTAARLRRIGGAAVLLATTLALSACDGPAQYSAIKVMVLVQPDGTGEMSWRVPARVGDDEMDEYGRQFASALGLPEPVMSPVSGPAALSGLPTDHVDVEFGPLLEFVASEWPDSAHSVFVSLCTPHANGTASGSGIELIHDDACALYVIEGPGSAPAADSHARITFESRWHPAAWQGLWLLLAVIAGVVAFVFARKRHHRWNAVAVVVAAAAPIACVWIALRALDAATPAEFLVMDTGLDFDRNFDGPFSMVTLGGFTAALMLLIGYFLFRPTTPKPSAPDKPAG